MSNTVPIYQRYVSCSVGAVLRQNQGPKENTPITLLCYYSFPSLSRSTRFFRVKHHPFYKAFPEFPNPKVSPFLNSCGMNDNEDDPLMSSVTVSFMCQLDLTKSCPGSWKNIVCGYVCCGCFWGQWASSNRSKGPNKAKSGGEFALCLSWNLLSLEPEFLVLGPSDSG